MKTLRVGVIGAGGIGEYHCSDINKHGQAKVTAAADISAERLAALKKRFGIEKTYARWQDLVADPAIDAVTIALPNALHLPVGLAALRAGKHLLMEKPFAMNQAEARRIIAAARKAGVVFMVGMNQRFERSAQTVKTLVERGALGEIYHAKAYWLRRSGSPKFGTWFCRKGMAGGGCMLDIGVHMLDLCLYLMDNWKPVSVSGAVYTKFGNRGIGEGGWGKSDRSGAIFDVDDFATALIKFRNGATLQLDASWIMHMETPGRHDVELFGTEGGAAVFPARVFGFGSKKGQYKVVEPRNVKVRFPRGGRFANWLDVILGKAKPVCSHEQALVVQKILDAIYRSAKTGRESRIG